MVDQRLHHLSILYSKMKITREKSIEAILVIVTGLLILSLIFKWPNVTIAAAVIGVLGVFSNFFAEKITWVWMKIAEVLGYINARILLSVIFFVFLFPLALLTRLIKGNTLKLKRNEAEGDSYFDERNHTYEPKDIENLW